MPPNIVKTIHEEVKVKATKAEIIKAWAPIVTAVIALIGTVVVALISAPSSRVDSVVNRLDEKVIPKLEEKIDKLEVQLAELDVYRKVFEKEIDKLKSGGIKSTGPGESIESKFNAAKAKLPKATKFELPRVQMEQRVIPLDVAAEK
jgi:hypothetical protein